MCIESHMGYLLIRSWVYKRLWLATIATRLVLLGYNVNVASTFFWGITNDIGPNLITLVTIKNQSQPYLIS